MTSVTKGSFLMLQRSVATMETSAANESARTTWIPVVAADVRAIAMNLPVSTDNFDWRQENSLLSVDN